MIVRPLKKEDFGRMAGALQPAQAHLRDSLLNEEYQASALSGPAMAVEMDGRVIFLGGVIEMWSGRALAWSLVSSAAAPHLLRLTRETEKFFAALPYHRIECYVDWDFTAGHRWAALLGFEFEGRMKCFSPLGTDMAMYGRVNDG